MRDPSHRVQASQQGLGREVGFRGFRRSGGAGGSPANPFRFFPLSWRGPAGSSPTAGNADRAVLYVVRRLPAVILASGTPLGQRDLRRLLVTGAMTVVRQASRRGEITDPWLAGMLARKPKMLVAVALANRTARRVWALATRKETYRVRAAA